VRAYLDHGDDVLGMHGLALFAAADRQRHIRSVIQPTVERGEDVVCDRYVYSTFAYFMARGLPLDFLKAINPMVPVPSLTVLLDVPAQVTRTRVQTRDGAVEKYEEQRIEFMDTVRRNLLAVADDSFLVIDGQMASEQIHLRIREAVSRLG
jgi:dTMP kinase